MPKTMFRTLRLSRRYLEGLRDSGKKTDIELVGLVVADEDVTPELIEQTVSSARIHGRIIATPTVKQSLLARDLA